MGTEGGALSELQFQPQTMQNQGKPIKSVYVRGSIIGGVGEAGAPHLAWWRGKAPILKLPLLFTIAY